VDKDKKEIPDLIFSRSKKIPEPPAEDTYLEDTVKSIGESKVAIDSYEEEDRKEGGVDRSARFSRFSKLKGKDGSE
jgi:hypothetical protein